MKIKKDISLDYIIEEHKRINTKKLDKQLEETKRSLELYKWSRSAFVSPMPYGMTGRDLLICIVIALGGSGMFLGFVLSIF